MYEVHADDVVMKRGLEKPPSQATIDRLAVAADGRGWNGTTLTLVRDGKAVRELFPSDEAKALYK